MQITPLKLLGKPTAAVQLAPCSPAQHGFHAESTNNTTLRLFFAGFGQDPQLFSQCMTAYRAVPSELAPLDAKGSSASDAEPQSHIAVYMLSHYGDWVLHSDQGVAQLQAELSASKAISPQCDPAWRELQELVRNCAQVEIVAWSFGVWAALAYMGALSPEILAGKTIKAIAVCGTVEAVDDAYGIPAATYSHMCRALLHPRLGPKTMQGFAQQVTTKADLLSCFQNYYRNADLQQLGTELLVLPHLQLPDGDTWRFTHVYLSKYDAIFALNNAQASWLRYGLSVEQCTLLEDEHLPMQTLQHLLCAQRWHV